MLFCSFSPIRTDYFTKKELTIVLHAGKILQARAAVLRLFVNPFLRNFIGNRETVMFYGAGGLCL